MMPWGYTADASFDRLKEGTSIVYRKVSKVTLKELRGDNERGESLAIIHGLISWRFSSSIARQSST